MAPGTSHTFLFADLAGFTALASAMGDASAADIAEDFAQTVLGLAGEHGAEQIKTIGDAVMARASDAGEAVRFGLRIAHDVGGQHFFPAVRVGMHTGVAIERAGDWFGATVNIAARVAGEARGGDVLLTETTRRAAGTLEGIDLHELGRRELRNVPEPLVLFAAVPQGRPSDAGLPIDPVCRMAVNPVRCAGTLSFRGREYHFCSLDCAAAFGATPERFLRD